MRLPPLAFLLLLTLFAAGPASAQYMYLDSNGDGVHTSADILAASGPTAVDIWLVTDRNRDGSAAVCPTANAPLTLMSYEFVLHATGGSVSWSGFTNRISGYATSLGQASSPFDYRNGYGSGVLQAGTYRLASINITVTTGTPAIQIVPGTPLNSLYVTSFASQCFGNDFDNTLKLGGDWFDVDGLTYGGQGNRQPEWGSIVNMVVDEASVADQSITATDADGNPLTFSKASGPAFVTISTTSPGSGAATGNIHVAPGARDGGHYSAAARVSDGVFQVDRFFGLDVLVTRSPIDLPPIADITVAQHATTSFQIAASSPDANLIQYSLASGPGFVTIQPSGKTAQVVLKPALSGDVGVSSATIVAQDEVASDRETFQITVTPNPLPPTISVTASNIEISTAETVAVSALDPDGDAVQSLTFDGSGLPVEDLTSLDVQAAANGGLTGVLHWTPSTMGTFPLRFTATDASGASATVERLVTVYSRAALIDAPSLVRGVPFSPITFEVSVTDPDGDPILDLNADLGLPGLIGATFEEDPSHARGTFHWTPTDAFVLKTNPGVFDIRFFATDGGILTIATTRISVSYVDQDQIDANAMDLAVGSSGQVGYDLEHDARGLRYPKDTTHTLLYAMGPWIAGKDGSALRASRGGANSEFFPGTMAGPVPSPFVPRFRGYRLVRGDTQGQDYLEWPVMDGAPVDDDGRPRMDGDQMVWSVYNEFGQRNRMGQGWEFDAGTTPMGLEIRQSTFAFDAPGPLANMDFVRFRVTNPTAALLDSAHVAIWADPDIGNSSDDLVGCDPSLDLGYAYNAPGSDSQYGGSPPALGFAVVEGPGTLGAFGGTTTAFTSYGPTQLIGRGITPARSFVMMQGKNPDGTIMHEGGVPEGAVTPYQFDGNPVLGTGWLDTTPGDKRVILSCGPFRLGPGETQEFVAAILVGQGADRLSSVTALKHLVPIARYVAASHYELKPYVTLPSEITVQEGTEARVELDALDLDGDALTSLIADVSGLPLGNDATLSTNSDFTKGVFTWTPTFADAGTYQVRITAANTDRATFLLTVRVLNTNRAPIADAGGPYAGVAGVPSVFTAAGSADPDGDPLTYRWDFGDGDEAAGVTAQHIYDLGGSFDVVLTVRDGQASGTDSTTAEVASSVIARAYVPQGVTIKLASARPLQCLQVEPVAGSFEIEAIDATSIRLIASGTGSVGEIAATSDKTLPIVDRDHNGALELTSCFRKDDLRQLFDALPPGENVVAASVEGALTTGVRFRAPLSLRVLSSAGLASSVSPNPMNPEAVITFRLTQSGHVRVRLVDVHGRVVSVLEDSPLDAGYHDVHVPGRAPSGERLASGIYFYLIEAPQGEERGRIVVVK